MTAYLTIFLTLLLTCGQNPETGDKTPRVPGGGFGIVCSLENGCFLYLGSEKIRQISTREWENAREDPITKRKSCPGKTLPEAQVLVNLKTHNSAWLGRIVCAKI